MMLTIKNQTAGTLTYLGGTISILTGQSYTATNVQAALLATDATLINDALAMNVLLNDGVVDWAGKSGIDYLQRMAELGLPLPNAFIDLSNSTSALLAANATYTGTWVDVSNYSNLNVLVITDQVSATDGLKIEYSTDGVNIDDNDLFTIAANSGQQFSFPLPARYYRIRYTNGVTLQTSFRLSAKVHAARPKPSSQRVGTAIDSQQDAELVLAVPAIFSLTAASPTSASVGVSSASAVSANTSRRGLVLINNSAAKISFGLGTTAVLNSGITLLPGGVWTMDSTTYTTAQINAIAGLAASTLSIQELS